ncbi:DUF4160 domain-containing protein [Chryseobacterium koreense]|uniref:Transcriptional regulator n=1 Tax=Chryseobacterium koreense CCUG 49689 TaxID=1304281 RepID=A0A0J7J3F6_9FLAO|nr:DUF4160 domain-containing protein [Chryseobacterium koreense]KMQ72742.1 transcriptional regulator [Chryseobacterium koreense CCUG 49689]MBB5332926.1 hypothetical protein [Chryseobacterium koreense]
MPEISRFYGIIIQMFFKDHHPPHFHITYGEYRAVITIENAIVEGNMTSKALKLVFEWMELHKDELMENWELTQKGELPKAIEPLK